jgi:hypothetical protein
MGDIRTTKWTLVIRTTDPADAPYDGLEVIIICPPGLHLWYNGWQYLEFDTEEELMQYITDHNMIYSDH